MQLMILFAAGDIRSCRASAKQHFYKLLGAGEVQKGGKGDSAANRGADRVAVQNIVNVGLLLAKCQILDPKLDSQKKAAETLEKCEVRLREGMLLEIKDIRKRLHEMYRERLDQTNPGPAETKSKSQTDGGLNKRKTKAADFNDFRWTLSALGLFASLYHSLGLHSHCENIYALYITQIEEFYEPNSAEAANAYFMVGLYYFEREQY